MLPQEQQPTCRQQPCIVNNEISRAPIRHARTTMMMCTLLFTSTSAFRMSNTQQRMRSTFLRVSPSAGDVFADEQGFYENDEVLDDADNVEYDVGYGADDDADVFQGGGTMDPALMDAFNSYANENNLYEDDGYEDEDEEVTPAELMPIRRHKRPKKVPVFAIVGRPNVGKSALVNRIAGTQSGGAIVADESGITRDRTYRPAEFLGEYFRLVDTGGIVYDDNESLFARQIREQALLAIDEASAVIMVTDGQIGCTEMDLQIAQFLRKEVNPKIPVRLAVNKLESVGLAGIATSEFWCLGLGEPMAVSAIHGVGTYELLQSVFDGVIEQKSAIEGFGTKVKELKIAKESIKNKTPVKGEDKTDVFLREYGIVTSKDKAIQRYNAALEAFDEEEYPEEIMVAIIGRPNVGKSSLLNNIFGDTRAIVSEVAGTTRDSIDCTMERPPPPNAPPGTLSTLYKFVDTAGIRRKGKVEYGPEFFMVNRALRAIRRSDVVLLILDATAGVTEQDRVLAQQISNDGRACVMICNKWDAVVDKDNGTYEKSVKYFRQELPQIRWAPILFISAVTGQRVRKIYGAVDDAIKAHRQRFSTAILNEILRDAILWQPPPAKRNGSTPKIYYCNQVSTRPPTIVVFCNNPGLINDNYRRYLDRKFRESLEGFRATPIRWIFRGRRTRDVARQRKMTGGDPGDGGSGTSFPYPHAD
mmetsp:Transcript_64002/g.76953  ORF Transcript_64002/g.76953 Transcript_64002/m.76953 type:complete len:701 (-) Transcript_64002:189-2291(-)